MTWKHTQMEEHELGYDELQRQLQAKDELNNHFINAYWTTHFTTE